MSKSIINYIIDRNFTDISHDIGAISPFYAPSHFDKVIDVSENMVEKFIVNYKACDGHEYLVGAQKILDMDLLKKEVPITIGLMAAFAYESLSESKILEKPITPSAIDFVNVIAAIAIDGMVTDYWDSQDGDNNHLPMPYDEIRCMQSRLNNSYTAVELEWLTSHSNIISYIVNSESSVAWRIPDDSVTELIETHNPGDRIPLKHRNGIVLVDAQSPLEFDGLFFAVIHNRLEISVFSLRDDQAIFHDPFSLCVDVEIDKDGAVFTDFSHLHPNDIKTYQIFKFFNKHVNKDDVSKTQTAMANFLGNMFTRSELHRMDGNMV